LNIGEFELVSEISKIETIAVNVSIHDRFKLTSKYGGNRWRKLKGIALVRFPSGAIQKAEVHWYEAHGVGRRKMKIKQVLK
jgi:hypothetical protein